MRHATLLSTAVVLLSLTACSTPPAGPPGLAPPAAPAAWWQPQAFRAPAVPPPTDTAAALFELTPAMLAYAEQVLQPALRQGDPRRSLLQALYERPELRLHYDDSRTRTAAQAFEARAGNCLSLVVMTAAFARHLGMPATFQEVLVPDTYTRRGGLTLASGHVNLVLAPPRSAFARGIGADADLTVDFLPPAQLGRLTTRPLTQARLQAMFLNNRAAEWLTEGRLDEAYAWASAAVAQAPDFAPALNTLAVVYLRADLPAAAETLLRHLLQAQPEHTAALSNLVAALQRQGRQPEALQVAGRLAQLQPQPPFADLLAGRQALEEGRLQAASDHFERELRRHPGQPEVHLWAAQASWRRGDAAGARRHLEQALAHSVSPQARLQVQGKLAALQQALTAAPPPPRAPGG